MKIGRLGTALTVILVACGLYFGAAALLLRFGMDRILFPAVQGFSGPPADTTVSVSGQSAGEMLIRRYGQARVGCVVFFPGQHGASAGYSFANYTAAGLAVYSFAYPGQDGAAGRTQPDDIERLVAAAVRGIGESCPLDSTVYVGVSLGSMLAVNAAQSSHPAGLVLVSAAPSLSAAIRVRLESRLVLRPITWLPVSRLLHRDYSLAEGLAKSPDLPVVIFQGTQDDQAPIKLLQDSGVAKESVRLVAVPGAGHSTAFDLSVAAQVSEILAMLKTHGRT